MPTPAPSCISGSPQGASDSGALPSAACPTYSGAPYLLLTALYTPSPTPTIKFLLDPHVIRAPDWVCIVNSWSPSYYISNTFPDRRAHVQDGAEYHVLYLCIGMCNSDGGRYLGFRNWAPLVRHGAFFSLELYKYRYTAKLANGSCSRHCAQRGRSCLYNTSSAWRLGPLKAELSQPWNLPSTNI